MPNAFYIKLGRAGAWEAESIAKDIMRIGWEEQRIDEINAARWDLVEKQLRGDGGRSRGAITTDLNRLRDISGSTPEDVWITFYQGKLWWTNVESGLVEADAVSKFRRVRPWSDRSLSGSKLFASELPGKIAALQGFRGTVCGVKDADLLQGVLSGEPTPLRCELMNAKAAIQLVVAEAIKGLHWKDFETLTDLVFRAAGWVRIGVLGETVKSFDLELREPITGDRYAVQVKSQADLGDLQTSMEGFSLNDYKRLFFVVHSPAVSLAACRSLPAYVDLVLPSRMSELVVDAGLLRWVEDRLS